MRKLLYIVIVILIGPSCSILKPYTYVICVRHSAQQSKIKKNKLIGVGDTIVNIIGQTIEKETYDVVPYAYLMLTNRNSKITVKQMADSLGNFDFTMLPGQYNIVAKCVGYADLDTLINLEMGEIRKLQIVLGEAGGFTKYQIKSPKRISEEELNSMSKDFQNEKPTTIKPKGN